MSTTSAEREWLVERDEAWFVEDPACAEAAEERARTLAQAGEADAALDKIEQLLAGPGWLSVHTLRLDPRWDPIREHPRFQSLLEQCGN